MKDWRVGLAALVGVTVIIGTAHAITDTAFVYSAPKTGYRTLNPGDLAPGYQDSQYSMSPSTLIHGTGPCYLAGVHLPQGAKIKQVAVWYQNKSDNLNPPHFRLYRFGLSNGVEHLVASRYMDDNSNTRKVAAAAPLESVSTVDNGHYRYTLMVCLETVGNQFYGSRITYTYTHAGD